MRPAVVNTPKTMTLTGLKEVDVVMNWKCSVPVTAELAAGDAPAGTTSHTAVAAAAVAAILKKTILFT